MNCGSMAIALRAEYGEVSPFLVDELRVGDELEIHGPLGRFFLWHPPVEGDGVDYDLQVFFGRYAGGEPVAADDADEASFFTLAEMEASPVLDSVLDVGRGLLGK